MAYKIPLPPGEAWHVPPGFFPFSETEPLHIVDRTGHVVLATGKHDVAREVVLFWRGRVARGLVCGNVKNGQSLRGIYVRVGTI